MSQNDERELFEACWPIPQGCAWVESVRGYGAIASGAVELRDYQKRWEGWQARAALANQRAEVPQGWKLVPVEPTSKMIKAAGSAWVDQWRIYRDMLAAAPAQPEQQASSEASDKDRADYWQGRAVVAERKLAQQPERAALKPLTYRGIEEHLNKAHPQWWATERAAFHEGASFAERAHGIGLPQQGEG